MLQKVNTSRISFFCKVTPRPHSTICGRHFYLVQNKTLSSSCASLFQFETGETLKYSFFFFFFFKGKVLKLCGGLFVGRTRVFDLALTVCYHIFVSRVCYFEKRYRLGVKSTFNQLARGHLVARTLHIRFEFLKRLLIKT